MGADSKIQWTDHTFNPWWGCVRVSPGCEHCYAEAFSKRLGNDLWGPAKTTPRKPASESYWGQPLKWNRAAEKAGQRARVFCASMADAFEDHPQLPPLRERLWAVIERTPWLDWLLLTKRPENVMDMVPKEWHAGFPTNVWLGTSVEDQRRADERIPHLLRCPAAVRFLSCEPLLGPVDVAQALTYRRRPDEDFGAFGNVLAAMQGVDWVIVGGESGRGARRCEVGWLRWLVEQCQAVGVPVFVKQVGANTELIVRDPKGGDPSEWPEDLRVREWPLAEREAR